MRTQLCREAIELRDFNCYGMSKGASSEVKLASKFCRDRAPYLGMQSTKSITSVRVIQDPIIQGKVLEMIKAALETGEDPRTGERFVKAQVGVITTPMIKWMIQYAETGTKPMYIPRGTSTKTHMIDHARLEGICNEMLQSKQDRRTGEFLVQSETMSKLRVFYEEELCKSASL